MSQCLIVQFSNYRWGVPIPHVIQVANLNPPANHPSALPEQICVGNRAVVVVEPCSILGVIAYETIPTKITKVVVINRANLWLALAVEQVLTTQAIQMNQATWLGSFVPIGIRRDLIQGVGTTSQGDPILVLDVEAFIGVWQQQAGREAFPLPPGPRLGEKILTTDEKIPYSGQEQRSHLRLDQTERILIQKSKQSGYPAYRAVISFQKNLSLDSVQLTKAVKLLQSLGNVIGSEAIYQPKVLGKFGRHLGMFYITNHPPETVLNRLYELEEVDKVEMVQLR